MAQSNGYDGSMIPLRYNNYDARTSYEMDNLNLEVCPRSLLLNHTMTPEMMQLIEQRINGVAATRTPCTPEVKKVEKLKAGHLPMCTLRIGFYKMESQYATHLVAKFYYGRRRLAWEMLSNGFKDKIEIQWQNFSAIRAVMEKNSPGILEIELDKVPTFFHEMELQRGKHSTWTESHDFTNGHASQCRRHYLQFAPGVLDQHYAKLLQCDNRLMELSQRSFPSSRFPYFESHLNQGKTQFSFGHDLHIHGSQIFSSSEQQPILFLPEQVQQSKPLSLIANDGQTSGIYSPMDEAINNQMLRAPMLNPYESLHADPVTDRCRMFSPKKLI